MCTNMNMKPITIVMMGLLAVILLLPGCDSIKNLFGTAEENQPPTIRLQPEKTTMALGETQTIIAVAADPDQSEPPVIRWEADNGTISADSNSVIRFTAPLDTMQVEIRATAIDNQEAQTTGSVVISIGNSAPVISSFTVSRTHLLPGNTLQLSVVADDPENQRITYHFQVEPDSGTIMHDEASQPQASWTAPVNPDPNQAYPARYYQVIAEVRDPLGFFSRDTAQVLVYSEFESIWVVDSGSRTAAKYTANGLPIITAAESFRKPVAVASNILESYGCYVADYDAGSVFKIDAEGQTIASYSNIPNVIDLDVYQIGRTIWALSVGENTLTVIDGFQDVVIKKIYGFSQPQAIAINQASGDVWIAEPANDRLIRLNATDPVSSWPDTITYSNCQIFPDSGTAGYFNTTLSPFVRDLPGAPLYLADKNDTQIERMIWDGDAYLRSNPPVDIPPLQPRFVGAASVANLGDVVIALSVDGRWIAFPESDPFDLHLLSGDYDFRAPNTFTMDSQNGYAWVGDNGTNQLVQVKFGGQYQFTSSIRISGFIFLEDVVINR